MACGGMHSVARVTPCRHGPADVRGGQRSVARAMPPQHRKGSAHCLGFGEKGATEKSVRAIRAQHLGFGENGRARSRLWRASEKDRPAYLRERWGFSPPEGALLSKGGILRGFRPLSAPAKSKLSKAETTCRESRASPLLWRTPRPHTKIPPKQGQCANEGSATSRVWKIATTRCTPTFPKQGRCSDRHCASTRLRRIDAAGTRRPLERLCDRQPQFRRC